MRVPEATVRLVLVAWDWLAGLGLTVLFGEATTTLGGGGTHGYGVGCPVWGGDSNPGRCLSKTCPGLDGWPAPGLTPFDRLSENPPLPTAEVACGLLLCRLVVANRQVGTRTADMSAQKG